MTKAYSYLRWSDARQGKGDSEHRQLSSAKEYAAAHGLELDTGLVDRGVSGYTGANRTKGNLGRFLAMVQDGVVREGEYLLVDSMDRLSRLPLNEAAAQLLNLANAGVVVVTLNDGMKFDRAVDLATMINAVLKMQGATDYSKELGRKVKRGHSSAKRKAREEGRIYSKAGPGWLTLNADRTGWIECQARVNLVRQIFEWSDNGGLGQRVIANRLAAMGAKPFKQGKGWHETTVRKLLQNRMVLGEYQPRFRDGSPDGEPITGYYGEGIIAADQFHRVQARFGRPSGRRNGGEVLNNLFLGICSCHECGSRVGVAIRSKDKRPLFVCRNTAEGMMCKNRTRYRVAEFERAVIRHVAELDLTRHQQPDMHEQALKDALAHKSEIEQKVRRLIDIMEDGDEHIEARYRQRVAELKAASIEVERLQGATKSSAARHKPTKHQDIIRETMDSLLTLTGRELYDARARVSAALRAIIDLIDFDPDGSIRVILHGGDRAYWFRNGQLIDDYDLRGDDRYHMAA